MSVPLDTRHVEAILALAEELNFTRAATRLNLVQSTLSRQIEQAEGLVGFPICDRNSKQVVFTEAGSVLVEELRRAKQHINLGIHRGQAAHEGKEHFLLVGYLPCIDPKLLSLMFNVRLPQYPKLRVETTTDVAPALIQKLLDGVLNMAIITRPMPCDTLVYTQLAEAPLYAVMQDDHPAASKGSVCLADFAKDCWVVYQESAHPFAYKSLMDYAKSLGIILRELHHILTTEEVIFMVSSGVGISFLTEGSARRTQTSGLVCRPLTDAPLLLETHTAIRRADDSKLVNAFVRTYHRKHRDILGEPQMRLPL